MYRFFLKVAAVVASLIVAAGVAILMFALMMTDPSEIVSYGIAGWMTILPGGSLLFAVMSELSDD